MKLIFDRWTALQIVIDHQMAGTQTKPMVEAITTHTYDFFHQHGQNVEVDELEGNYTGYFEECFDLELQDGSASQVARSVVMLFRELGQVAASKVMAEDSDYEDSEEEESGSEEEMGM
ncbi:hypothetical protein BC829DRAFT_448614 [Chytridium lagenaria]|nr:hypothetical protein BC829DRAFT_448614 [Chytridium lagenaria]